MQASELCEQDSVVVIGSLVKAKLAESALQSFR